jgi:hypothetical protein
VNEFFSLLSKHPNVMLRLLFSLVFIAMGVVLILIPSVTNGADVNTRLLFGSLMLIYGGYRFLTFWWEFKKAKQGEV